MKGWKRLAFPTAKVLLLVTLSTAGAATVQRDLPTWPLLLVLFGCAAAAAALFWSSEDAPPPPACRPRPEASCPAPAGAVRPAPAPAGAEAVGAGLRAGGRAGRARSGPPAGT